MEDEQRDTQKKKIQILFQLGKWSDVVKLCASYAEKYGKDMEIDMIRFKSERHMGVPDPTPPQEDPRAMPQRQEPSRPPVTAAIVSDPSIPLIPPEHDGERGRLGEEPVRGGLDDAAGEIDLGDPFSVDDLVISDPFASEEPPVTMASSAGPPIIINDSPAPGEIPGAAPEHLELEEPGGDFAVPPAGEEPGAEPVESEPDLASFGGLTLDAEPDLVPAAPPPPQPRPGSVGTMYGEAKEEARPGNSRGARAGAAEEPSRERKAPSPSPEREEKPHAEESLYAAASGTAAPEPKKRLNVKLLLFIILPLLAAAALWLVLSGKINLPQGDEPSVQPQPATRLPARRRPPAAKAPVAPPSQGVDAQAAEAEKAFAEKLLQAEKLEKQGETLKAWAVLLEAKKIKVSEPLQQLEERLARKMQEEQAQAQKEKEVVQSQWELETQALAKAQAANTIAGWQAFLRDHPQSGSAPMVEARIASLEKKAQESALQQLQQRIQLEQKARLRAASMNLSPAEVVALARQGGRLPARFESHAHGGATVMLDLTAGLMWTLYDRPMAFDKARWWANRVSAGYGGWRLPTADEALSLLQMERGRYSGLAGFAVWTSDTVSDQPRTVWALKLPEGQFLPRKQDEVNYVWAVRKAGK